MPRALWPLALHCLAAQGEPPPAAPLAEHVLVIGVDGLSPDGIVKARTPIIDALAARGAHTFHARGVMPTESSPNWASMIMGAGPEQHGVTSNKWRPDSFEIAPTAVGSGGFFPTVFSVLRAQRPDSVIAVFHDWDDFGRLVEPAVCDAKEDLDGPVKTAERAAAYLKGHRPRLAFVHLDHVDHAGHDHGHGSPEYYAAVEEADRLIGRLADALRDAGMLEKTVVLVTSDHGGVGKGHGGATLAELEIPWIVAGPGIAAGKEVKTHVNTYDTAATIAHLLGLTPPEAWIARTVSEAFATSGRAPKEKLEGPASRG
ncbi:MAG: alkaline phosphatase [Planctomycetes bacterium]|nr:alkaline phosphatase [Planctomycetota bacterium]